jgi:plastocyanin
MQTKFFHIKTVLAATGVAASLVAAGCGNDSQADLINGKQLFTEKCGACHTLARAESAKGVVGPNLDKAFGPARTAGMTSATIQGVVIGQIKHPSQRLVTQLRMPPNVVTGMDARDVAAYVGIAAGASGKDVGALAQAGKPETSTKTVAADGSNLVKLSADPSGATKFDAGKVTAKVGKVGFVLDNPSGTPHNIALKGNGVNVKGKIVAKGGKSEIETTVKPGTYTFYCSVPGHEAGGMKGTLTVK